MPSHACVRVLSSPYGASSPGVGAFKTKSEFTRINNHFPAEKQMPLPLSCISLENRCKLLGGKIERREDESPVCVPLCEAQSFPDRSLPKEPREAKQISLHRAFGIQPRSDQAIQRHVGLLLL